MREPPLDFPAYKSTALRHPKQPLIVVGPERGGPALAHLRPGEISNDLTNAGPVGERITVTGRLLDSDGRPVPDSLVEIWQANAAGRYRHKGDQWPAP
jgi:protocatechuate 3,4-dioxygenase beta subunit